MNPLIQLALVVGAFAISLFFLDWDYSVVFYSKLLIFFIAFAMPTIAMSFCTGWNAGSMASSRCVFKSAFFKEYADAYYGFLFMSSFMVGIPIVLYFVLVIYVTNWLF